MTLYAKKQTAAFDAALGLPGLLIQILNWLTRESFPYEMQQSKNAKEPVGPDLDLSK